MQRRIDEQRTHHVWVERIVWNFAAAAALALMIVVLLCSLQWLDQVDPRASHYDDVVGGGDVGGRAAVGLGRSRIPEPSDVARVVRPGG